MWPLYTENFYTHYTYPSYSQTAERNRRARITQLEFELTSVQRESYKPDVQLRIRCIKAELKLLKSKG